MNEKNSYSIYPKSFQKSVEKELAAFCRSIKALRETHGLTKRRMAELLHISVKTLNLLESGICPPRLKATVFVYIYQNFGVLPSDLLH